MCKWETDGQKRQNYIFVFAFTTRVKKELIIIIFFIYLIDLLSNR
jgi:hypothetical protein